VIIARGTHRAIVRNVIESAPDDIKHRIVIVPRGYPPATAGRGRTWPLSCLPRAFPDFTLFCTRHSSHVPATCGTSRVYVENITSASRLP
jgi:hypothetical protein